MTFRHYLAIGTHVTKCNVKLIVGAPVDTTLHKDVSCFSFYLVLEGDS